VWPSSNGYTRSGAAAELPKFVHGLTGEFLDKMPPPTHLEQYWADDGERWLEFGGRRIKAKCTMAALAVGVWVEDQEGETNAEEWVLTCIQFGLFEIN
jgi:hypothetical protein